MDGENLYVHTILADGKVQRSLPVGLKFGARGRAPGRQGPAPRAPRPRSSAGGQPQVREPQDDLDPRQGVAHRPVGAGPRRLVAEPRPWAGARWLALRRVAGEVRGRLRRQAAAGLGRAHELRRGAAASTPRPAPRSS